MPSVAGTWRWRNYTVEHHNLALWHSHKYNDIQVHGEKVIERANAN